MITVSLSQIYNNTTEKPCAGGWNAIREHRGLSHAGAKKDDAQFPISEVFESNGLNDALWVMDRCINPYVCRLFAADCAEQVLHIFERVLPDDKRPHKAIAVARDLDATEGERAAAWGAARAAAEDAATEDPAWATAWATAEVAAWATAEDAAAEDAAWAAAWATAWATAEDAAKKRFLQYCRHGEAAKDMPWETPMVTS